MDETLSTKTPPGESPAPEPNPYVAAAEAAPLPPAKRGYLGIILRATVSIVLVAILATRVNGQAIVTAIEGLRWELWALGLVFFLCSQSLSAIRWAGLARGLGFQATLAEFFQWYFEGMFFSLCLPSSIGGDVLKAYRLAPRHPYDDVTPSGIRPDTGYTPTVKAAGRTVLAGCTVLADRLVGLLVLICLGLTAFIHRTYELSLGPTLGVGAGIFAAEILGVWLGTKLLTVAPRLFQRLPRISRLLDRLRPFGDRPGVLLRGLLWSVAVQVTNVFSVVWVGLAMGLEVPLAGYFVAVPVVAVATALPLSINGVGLREGGYALLLGRYGLTNDASVTLGLLSFLVILASGMLGGLVFLLRGKGQTPPT